MIEPMNFGMVNAKFMTFDMSMWVYSQWLDPPSHFCGWNPNSWCYFLAEISNFRCLIPNTWPKDLPAGYLQVGEVGDGHQPHGGDMVESWWWPEFHQSSHRSCGQSLQSRWQLGFTGSNREALAIFRRKKAGVRNMYINGDGSSYLWNPAMTEGMNIYQLFWDSLGHQVFGGTFVFLVGLTCCLVFLDGGRIYTLTHWFLRIFHT